VKAMRDLGLIRLDEPFTNLLTQGMVLNHAFLRRGEAGNKIYFAPDELDLVYDEHGNVQSATAKADGEPVTYEGISTMSKSKRNGVDPHDMIERYGADTSRFYVMQANPPTDTMLWSDASVEGSFRFLRGLWKTVHDHQGAGSVERYPLPGTPPRGREGSVPPALGGGQGEGQLSKELKDLRFKLHKTIDKVADDYGRRLQFNTAVAAIRELLNLYDDLAEASPAARAVKQEVLEDTVLMLSPIVPHIATALWEALRPGTRLLDQPWPAVDKSALEQDEIVLVVQVNGKLRGHVLVPAAASREQVEAFALANESVQKFVNGQKPKKVVVVPGKLVNVVV